MTKHKNFDWHYTRFGGVVAVCLVRLWSNIFRTPDFSYDLERPIDQNEVTVIASNHQTLMDPPGIFAPLSFNQLLEMSPVKFMAWHRIYNSVAKPILYSTGSYSTHGKGRVGVDAGVYYAKNGYRSFIFPEGKRQRSKETFTEPYKGVGEMLDELPNARLLLVFLDWEPRRRLFSRPIFRVHWFEAPKDLDRSSPHSIMDAIYNGRKMLH